MQQQQQQPRRSTVRVVYRGKGGCTGHCCINRFGELGVATPEGTAHVRIDYTHLFPAFNSLPLPLSLSLSFSFTLSRLGPLLDSLPSGDGFDSPCRTTHRFLSFYPFAGPFALLRSSPFSLFHSYSFIPPLFLLRFLALSFTLGPPLCARRALSPRGAHGARRSVIFKPFAL